MQTTLIISNKGQLEDVDAINELRAIVRANSPADATGSDIARDVAAVLKIAHERCTGHAFRANFSNGDAIAFVRAAPACVSLAAVGRAVLAA